MKKSGFLYFIFCNNNFNRYLFWKGISFEIVFMKINNNLMLINPNPEIKIILNKNLFNSLINKFEVLYNNFILINNQISQINYQLKKNVNLFFKIISKTPEFFYIDNDILFYYPFFLKHLPISYFSKNLYYKIKRITIKSNNQNKKESNHLKKNEKQLLINSKIDFIFFEENNLLPKISFDYFDNQLILNKLIIELYSYKLISEDEKLYFICMNIIKKLNNDPISFLKKICMKTQIKSLRTFLINHFKHLNNLTEEEEKLYDFINYLDKNYSNPSFDVEYRLKCTEILNGETYITSDIIEKNKKYDLQNYIILTNNFVKEKTEFDFLDYENYSIEKDDNYSFFMNNEPLITKRNLKILNEIISENINNFNYNLKIIENDDLNSIDEIYEYFFLNTEANDFGINIKNYQKEKRLKFYHDKYYYIIEKLLDFYNSEEFEENLVLLKKLNNKNDECQFCKRILSSKINENFHSNLFINNLGYSNITIENIKNMEIGDLCRIKFDDFLQSNPELKDIINYFSNNHILENENSINSIFQYLYSYNQINLIKNYLNLVISSQIFNEKYIDKSKIFSKYFSNLNEHFSVLNSNNIKIILNYNEKNNEEIISYFISNKIFLEENLININDNLIRILIKNEIFLSKKNKEKKSISKIDKLIDNYVLYQKDNYYLLQNQLDNKLFEEKIVFSDNYKNLDSWQTMIFFSKFESKDYINFMYEISMENLNNLTLDNPYYMKENEEVIFYILLGTIFYMKNNNDLSVFEQVINRKFKAYKQYNFNYFVNKFISLISNIIPSSLLSHLSGINPIFDIDIKSLVSNYYPYLKQDNLKNWRERDKNYNLFINEFNILIENGKILEAFIYFKENISKSNSKNLLYPSLYNICIFNLLNYNIFTTVVVFLYLTKFEEKKIIELIVYIEAANQILINEINNLTDDSELRNKLINFIKKKNYSKIIKYKNKDDLKIYILEDIYILLIQKYQKLILKFIKLLNIQKNSEKHQKLFNELLQKLETSINSCKENEQNKINSLWHLISLFTYVNNNKMSLKNLYHFGNHNNWIFFLQKAQEQNCSFNIISNILNSYFNDNALKEHLGITIKYYMNPIIIKNNIIDLNENIIKLKEDNYTIGNYEIYSFLQNRNDIKFEIFDPLYFMSLNKENIPNNLNKYNYILEEGIEYNWKDFIFVSLIYNDTQYNFISSFTFFLYMSIKEILLSIDYKNQSLKNINEIIEIFEPKKTIIKLSDLEKLINFLILNDYYNIIIDAFEIFDIPFSFDEFCFFIQFLKNYDFEEAFVHLYSFKSLIDLQKENILKNNEIMIFKFFISVSNNLIELFIDEFKKEKEKYKLFKLLEILYLVNWKDEYSNYFKNINVLSQIENIGNLNFKSDMNDILEELIKQNRYDIIYDYVSSYEYNNIDYIDMSKIKSLINSFDNHFDILRVEERIEFWNQIEEILNNCHIVSKSFVLWYYLNKKESNFYILEQLILTIKTYKSFEECNNQKLSKNIFENSLDNLKKLDFIKDKNLNSETIGNIFINLRNRIFILIFSHCNDDLIKKNLLSSNNYYTELNYIKLKSSFNEEEKPILFNLIKSEETFSNIEKACVTLIHFSDNNISSSICSNYNINFNKILNYNIYLDFIKDNYNNLKVIPLTELIRVYEKLKNNDSLIDEIEFSDYQITIENQLLNIIIKFLKFPQLTKLIRFNFVKILFSNLLNLTQEEFNLFEDNIESIFLNLINFKEIENSDIVKILINYLNEFIDCDKILTKLLMENNENCFKFYDYFDKPKNLSQELIKQNNIQFNFDKIFISYYYYNKDTSFKELKKLSNQIIDLYNSNKRNFKNNILELFQIFGNEKQKINYILYNFNDLLLKDIIGIEDCNYIKKQIKFYLKSKHYLELGNIYLFLNKEFLNKLSQSKDKIQLNQEIEDKTNYLIQYHFNIKILEMYLKGNYITNYNKIYIKLKEIFQNNFSENINIKI